MAIQTTPSLSVSSSRRTRVIQMSVQPNPGTDRRLESLRRRIEAAELARARPHPSHITNSEEYRYRDDQGKPTLAASFTKGLPHDVASGLISNPNDYAEFVKAIDSGDPAGFRSVALGPDGNATDPQWQSTVAQTSGPLGGPVPVRAWESASAGLAFDLEGADAQSVTMPPAPALDSDEFVFEMMEVYCMALVRDVPFVDWETNETVKMCQFVLNELPWITNPRGFYSIQEESRRPQGPLTTETVFRGFGAGPLAGGYLSQYLLRGTNSIGSSISEEALGRFNYGAIQVDQRVRAVVENENFMTTWEEFIDVQNGANLAGLETYQDAPDGSPLYKFMALPRDLATYVHFDALYEAYLNACLIMLADGVPFDAGLPFGLPDSIDKQQPFATFGGPHVLSLVCEVATRALKAVRYQKFNVHRRLRPEAVGGLVEAGRPEVEKLSAALNARGVANSIRELNCGSLLLPMAFPEGSPMHPSYGAGHATVAGACVTILKAFFDTNVSVGPAFEPSSDGGSLNPVAMSPDLTVGGELDKLAANISIGRNWAGVHYYTDYIESLRLGEEIAISILEEQKLMFNEEFSMSLPKFDGTTIRI